MRNSTACDRLVLPRYIVSEFRSGSGTQPRALKVTPRLSRDCGRCWYVPGSWRRIPRQSDLPRLHWQRRRAAIEIRCLIPDHKRRLNLARYIGYALPSPINALALSGLPTRYSAPRFRRTRPWGALPVPSVPPGSRIQSCHRPHGGLACARPFRARPSSVQAQTASQGRLIWSRLF